MNRRRSRSNRGDKRSAQSKLSSFTQDTEEPKKMIRTGYIAKWNSYPDDEEKIRVARPSTLAPSEELLEDYKKEKITWEEYEQRYRKEMQAPEAREKIREIRNLAETKPVRLICYEKNPPCHRFILKEIIEEEKENE